MNLSAPFIQRPVMTSLVMGAILLFGIMGYRLLPVSDLPNVDFPTISVSASLPGASPDTMASSVAQPLERAFSIIAGVDNMTSSNSQGSTQITLQFNLNRSIDAAAQDVQAAISQSLRSLPADMPSPPSFRKVNPADQPILMLALSTPLLPLSKVYDYADNVISQNISTINGVAQVQVYGSQKYAVRVQLDPRRLAQLQVGVDEVASAIRSGNVNMPTGTLYGPTQAFTVQATGQLDNAVAFRPLIVAYRNGSPVRLDEVATVFDDVETNKTAAWFNGDRAIVLAIQRQPGTNTVEVVDAIKAQLPKFKAQMPAAINLDILFDRSISIRNSVNDVKFTLVLTMGLVVMVIFLFLRNFRATIIPSLALPMSVIGTFTAMYLLGFSLDNLSLIALTLSVGFVVDDAIVMLENIVRHVEAGEKPMEAALRGSREIGFTILSMTMSLVAVFIPVIFMGGIVGRLLREFAITIAVAILVSGFVSLTLTPMLCSRFLGEHRRHGRLFNASEHVFNWALGFYRWSLQMVLRHSIATIFVFLLSVAATIFMFRIVPTGFIPSEDLGQISGTTEAMQGISYDSMVDHQKAAARIVADNPNIAAFMSNAGGGGGGNTGRFFIRLATKPPRKSTPEEVIQQLRPKMAQIPGLRAFFQPMQTISFGGRSAKSQYQFTLQGTNTDELYHWAPILEAKLRDLPDLQDVATDLQITNPQVEVKINRDKASTLGVTAQQIEDALFTAYGSRQISTIYSTTDAYKVILELEPKYQQDPAALSMLYIRTSGAAGNPDAARVVPLNTLASLDRNLGPLTVNHQGQIPAVTLSFNLKPGAALGTAVDEVQKLAQATLPATISTSFQGTAQAFAASFKGLGLLLILAILVIYIVLGILYESYIHPITILSGLPAAGVGALIALWLFHMQLDLYSFVGIILLVGIVKKNAIMMIDFALVAQREQGLSPRDAIFEGSLVRFRPIMMTTMAALTGTLPIALGWGAGAEARRPLGVAVVGGLLLSQMLTLYITPVFYVMMEWLRVLPARFGKNR